MTNQWLKCRVLKGMFSDERAIEFRMKGGRQSSEFVPSSKVRGEINQEGRVYVQVFRKNGTQWAVLPTEYSESVPVEDEDLVSQ